MGLFWGNESKGIPWNQLSDSAKRERIITQNEPVTIVGNGYSESRSEFMFLDMYKAIHETNALVKSLIEENSKLRQRIENLEKSSSSNDISRSFHSSRAV